MRKPLKRLNRRHLEFCELYALLVPPAVAYAKAIEGRGATTKQLPSAEGAAVVAKHPGNAARLLREPLIQEEIRRLLAVDEAMADPTFIAYRRSLIRAELDRIAFFRLPDVLTRKIEDWTDDERAAVSEISATAEGKRKVKAHSKTDAIAQLIKLDRLDERDEQDGVPLVPARVPREPALGKKEAERIAAQNPDTTSRLGALIAQRRLN